MRKIPFQAFFGDKDDNPASSKEVIKHNNYHLEL